MNKIFTPNNFKIKEYIIFLFLVYQISTMALMYFPYLMLISAFSMVCLYYFSKKYLLYYTASKNLSIKVNKYFSNY